MIIHTENVDDNLQEINNEINNDNNIKLAHDLNKSKSVKLLDDKDYSNNQQKISTDNDLNNTLVLGSEGNSDNNISVNGKEVDVDNNQTIDDEDHNKNIQTTEKYNLNFDSNRNTNEISYKFEANISDDTIKDKKKPKKQLTPFERNQLIQKQMLLVEEKRKKDEAYSGRLDAIKNQVAVLNQQLDQLENVKPNYTK